MTRTELEELVVAVANDFDPEITAKEIPGLIAFSHALLVEIQKKLEVVGYMHLNRQLRNMYSSEATKLVTLPIIEE